MEKDKEMEKDIGLDIDWDKLNKDPLDDVKALEDMDIRTQDIKDPLDDVKTLNDIKKGEKNERN